MSRGPLPQKAIDTALPVAKIRGFVIVCRRYRGSVVDFIVAEPGGSTSLVRMVRTKRLHESLADMQFQLASGIAALRRVPESQGRTRELWGCDYYGNLRFFRLAGTGLVEIDSGGRPVNEGDGTARSSMPAGGPV
jgi:hypothetical protein